MKILVLLCGSFFICSCVPVNNEKLVNISYEEIVNINNQQLCQLLDRSDQFNGRERGALIEEQIFRKIECMDGYVWTTSLGNSSKESEENEIVENIGNAKLACEDLGLEAGTERYGECVLQLSK